MSKAKPKGTAFVLYKSDILIPVKNKLLEHITSLSHTAIYAIVVTLIAVGTITYGAYQYHTQTITLQDTRVELASTSKAFESIQESFVAVQKQNTQLLAQLESEQVQNSNFGQQIESISSTVGQLYKLSQTDKELLQKYSNVYFLNENYVPSQLSPIDTQYLYRADKPEQIHSNVKAYLQNMMNAAASNSSTTTPVNFFVLSAYRSFGTQTALKTSYKITYGTTAANKFSADQGYSEHQLGSAVDFTTLATGDTLTGFEKTSAYTWLTQNAYKYGFILSYPPGNRFYIFEPWHWRFVGVALATRLHDENKYFYDLDQRTIDTYLVNIFD